MAKILYILLTLCFINTAFAIQCYECDSSKNSVCNFGLLSFTQNVRDCGQSDGTAFGILSQWIPHNCIKLVGKDASGNEYVARGCGVNTGPINACDATAKTIGFMSSYSEKVDLKCYTCDTDKCNSAASLTGMAVFSILAASVLFLF